MAFEAKLLALKMSEPLPENGNASTSLLNKEASPSVNDAQSRKELLSTEASSEQETPSLIGETDILPGSQVEASHTQTEGASSPSSEEPRKTYEDCTWRRLPVQVQEAAIRLGYTKEIWNKDLEPESMKKWDELDAEELEAAKLLGYDKSIWDAEKTPKDYDKYSWKDLPKRIQEAYAVLGYDKELWDKDESHATAEKDWDELTEEERRAAMEIGYTAELWNEDDSDESDEGTPRNEPLEESMNPKTYNSKTWAELPREVRDAAQVLGYTEENWNTGKEPEVSDKYWEELSKEQKEAAVVLGYNEARWNFGDKEIKPRDYDDMFWNELPKDIKEAYKVLGYNEDLWDRDQCPAAIDKDWIDLTKEERNGAKIVGYTEETWDEDSDDDDSDHDEPKNINTGFKGAVLEFLLGSSYVLLDCMSMAAFFGVIESVFMVGTRFLDDNAVNALKIVFGLAIMQGNDQFRRWLGADKATKKARSRQRRDELTLFRSFLNVFSWWTMFAGVNHFFFSFEKEILSKRAEEWFRGFYEIAEKAFEEELKSGAVTGNVTCTYIQNFDFNHALQGFVLGKVCELSENKWEAAGHLYYCLAFLASAVPMWLLFDDNFLKGCDV